MVGMLKGYTEEMYNAREVAMSRFEAAINVLVDAAVRGDINQVELLARNLGKNIASGNIIPTNF